MYNCIYYYRSNHSGHNGTLASSAGASMNSDEIDNGEHLLNNNTVDNGITEICDVPDHVANQKRHVSPIILYSLIFYYFYYYFYYYHCHYHLYYNCYCYENP